MNRRSFLKFLPAGVLGAKHAAAEAAESLVLRRAPIGGIGYVDHGAALNMAGGIGGPSNSWAIKELEHLLDPRTRAMKRANIRVESLDPDLASMKSMSLGVRLEIQKDRLLDREVDRERSRLENIIAGIFD